METNTDDTKMPSSSALANDYKNESVRNYGVKTEQNQLQNKQIAMDSDITKVKKRISEANRQDRRFGAVKIDLSALAQKVSSKTFVVTSTTTARELLVVILSSGNILSCSAAIFHLSLRRVRRQTDSGSPPENITLADSDIPLLLQGRYSRGEVRFSVDIGADTILIRVRINLSNMQQTVVHLLIGKSTTSGSLIEILTKKINHTKTSKFDLSLCEVDVNCKVLQELNPDQRPFEVAQQWSDPEACCFELRELLTANTMRRAQSLPSLENGGVVKLDLQREVRRSFIPRRRHWRKSHSAASTYTLSPVERPHDNGGPESTITKLKDNLSKLRKCLDSSQQRHALPMTSMSDTSGDERCYRRPVQQLISPHQRPRQHKQRSTRQDLVNGYDTDDTSDSGSGIRERRHRPAPTQQNLHTHTQRYAHGWLTKSQSMMELEGSNNPVSGNYRKPERIKSASSTYSHPDASRVIIPAPSSASCTRETRDLADQWVDAPASRSSSSVSMTSNRSKGKRALPSMPNACAADELEQRRQRMAQRVLRRVQKGAGRRHDQHSHNEATEYAVHVAPVETDVLSNDGSQLDACHNLDAEPVTSPNSGGQSVHYSEEERVHRLPVNYANDARTLELSSCERESGSSKEALQRIINDLRDASNKPIHKHNSYSHTDTGSWDSPPLTRSSPLESDTHVEPEPVSPAPDYTDSAETNDDSYKQCNNTDQRHRHHPSLHQIVNVCDLLSVEIENTTGQNVKNYGIEIFESLFSEFDGHSRHLSTFRSPEGRRPVIGGTQGAFIPVTSCVTERDTKLSLNAIDYLKENSIANMCGQLQDGDYIIEVNDVQVVMLSEEETRSELARNQTTLRLVVARARTEQRLPVSVRAQIKAENDEAIQCKELAKLRLKYNCLHAGAEKSLDTIADLQLDIQQLESQAAKLEQQLQQKTALLETCQSEQRQSAMELAAWRREARQLGAEVTRMRTEAKKREARVVQLRRLLIQQTEVMHLQGLNGTDGVADEDDDEDEHVSEV